MTKQQFIRRTQQYFLSHAEFELAWKYYSSFGYRVADSVDEARLTLSN